MTDREQALTDLLAKVDAGDQPQPKDFRAALEVPMQDMRYTFMPNDARAAYGGSLDAAKALHDAVLPDEGWELWRTGKYPGMIPGSPDHEFAAAVGWGHVVKGYADTPARAWLIAILKALIAQEKDDE